ncbi:MAG: hypothetical protein WCJ67_00235 [Thermoleophilia bacterium]
MLAVFVTGAVASSAAPSGIALWSGVKITLSDGVPLHQTILLSVNNGLVTAKSVQVFMACVDSATNEANVRAFSATSTVRHALSRNRLNYSFSARSGGYIGRLTLTGQLNSNGLGTMRVTLIANSFGGVGVDRCRATVNFVIRRGNRQTPF